MDIKIPFLGDGIDSAKVLSVSVSVGDSVDDEQTILELETDKAVAPVPSTGSGTIKALTVKEGDMVSQGMVVATLDGAGSDSSESASSTPADAPATPPAAPVAAPAQATFVPQQALQAQPGIPAGGVYQPTGGTAASTSPWIRSIAEATGLDLGRIPGTGRSGRITIDDIRQYVTFLQSAAFSAPQGAPQTQAAPQKPPKPSIDFSKWGPVDIEPMTGLRQKISEKMVDTWNEIPHVTQFDEADVTQLLAMRKKYVDAFKKKGVRLTVTVLMMKAIVETLKKFPNFNASIQNGEIIYKKYYHIGIAVDTENGLLVPVIRDVDKKSLLELSKELAEVAEKAKQRKLSLDDMQGGCFTISNLGGLGVGSFTPIVNQPEVAILGLSKGKKHLYLEDSTLKEADMLPLSLSYDHRIIDGADGARFMRSYIETLQSFDEKLFKAKK